MKIISGFLITLQYHYCIKKHIMKRFLLAFAFLFMAHVAVNAQTAYAQLNNHVLTFKYGTMPTTGTTYSVPLNATSMSQVPWYPDRTEVTKVVFDNSFANVNNLVSIFMWFANMSNLTEIQGIQNLNTSHVINMMSTFAFTKLSSLNLSTFDTQNVETMQAMFAGSTMLYSLDLSSFETPNLTNTSYMFSMNYLDPILTTIDMSSFDMSHVTTTDGMFQGNDMLKTVYCNCDCSASSVLASSNNMFNGCTRIVGGNGTTYDASHIDASYARPDAAGSKGYFTGQASEPEYIVTLLSNPEGAGDLSGEGSYNANDVAHINAEAHEGYAFVDWTVNGASLSTNPSYSFLVTGDITLTANFISTENVSENENAVTRVYPNPLNGSRMTVDCGGQARVSVYSTDGRCLYTHDIDGTTTIDTDSWQSGAYIVIIETMTETKMHKVVKL